MAEVPLLDPSLSMDAEQVRGVVSAMRNMMFPQTFGGFVAGIASWPGSYRVHQLMAEIRRQTQGEG